MKDKSIVLGGILLVASLIAVGLSSFRGAQKLAKPPVTNSSLLWKIEGNGLSKPSYLFGTMHMIGQEYFYFPKKLQKLIGSMESVLFEIDMNNTQNALQAMMLENGDIMDVFTDKQKDTVYTYFEKEMGLTRDLFSKSFGKFKPFMLVQLSTQAHFEGKVESYEKSILALANEAKITVGGLETIEQQISFFDQLSNEAQAEMVLSSIRDMDKSKALTKRMQGMYKRQNIDSLFLLMQSEGGTVASEQALFLDNRNIAWIPKIKAEMQNKSVFVAVGAGHLGGEKGVVSLLRKEGYTVTPTTF